MLARVSLLTALGAAGLVLAFALVGTGCRGLVRPDVMVTYTGKAEPTDVNEYYWRDHYTKKYASYVNGVWTSVYLKERETDPPGYFTGSSHVVSAKGKRSSLLAPFKSGTTAGTWQLEGTNVLSGSLLVLFKGQNRADALCLSLKGKTVPEFPTAIAIGTFTTVGGAGRGATLRAGGRFLLVSPKVPKPTATSVSFEAWMAVNSLSRGSPRALSTACKSAGKPAPPPVKASATLDGYVFAPAGAKSVPAGATVYPDGSSISGGVGCGSDNNLFLVVTYAGPATKATGGFFGPVSTNIDASVKAGKNLLLLGANLPNGSYSLKLGFASGAAPFGGNVFLQRSC